MPIREIKVRELRGARFGVAAAAATTTTTARASGLKRPVLQQLAQAQRAGSVAGGGHKSGFSPFQSASGQQLNEQQQQTAGALVATGQSDSMPYRMNHSELCSSAVCPVNVIMQPIREQKIQSINNDEPAQSVQDNDDDENNPSEQKKTNPLEKREKTGKESLLMVVGMGQCDDHHSNRRQRAIKLAPPPLMATLISSYCFLVACASVARGASTGGSSHNNQRASSTIQFERRLAALDEVARAPHLTGAQMGGAGGKIGDDLIKMVQPIAMLNVYENNNSNNHRHHHHAKFSSEQKQRDEVDISMKPSAAASSSLLVLKPDKMFHDDDDEEERQMLLVLASDTSESPSSSLRRLIKRSGISDQRLAEIQMIRALKKQLERAATKIAADSTGGGGAGDGGQETAAKSAA